MQARRLARVVQGRQTSDGAGVKLRRSLGWAGDVGPFVMNTREEILQAVRDFQEGRLA